MTCSKFLTPLAAPAFVAAPQFAAAFPGAGQGKSVQAEATASTEGAVVDPGAPVALVNGKPITKAEFDRAIEGYLRQFQRSTGGMHGGVAQANDQMKADVLGQLVDRELLYQESLKNPVADLDAQVQKEYEGYRGRFPSQEEFDKVLEAQGLDEATLKDLMGRQVQVRNYLETRIVPTIEITEEDVRRFYDDNVEKFATPEQVQCSHILIRVDPGADEETRKAAETKIKELQTRCAAGEDFAALAKEFSEDPGSAPSGGDLGFFAKQQMVAPFADAAFALEPGQVSDVVETRFGFHVIKMTDRKAAGQRDFAEVKESIENYLQSQALDAVVKERVAALKKDASIDVVAPHL